MNTQWNTPPDGDFASYVERLSAQSAAARKTSQADGEHSLEGGPGHEPAASRAAGSDHRIATAPVLPGPAPGPAWGRTAGASPLPFTIAKIVAAAWLLALVALVGTGVSAGLVIAWVLGGLWAAGGLRKWARPPSHSSWSAWLRETAAATARQQRDRRAGPKNR